MWILFSNDIDHVNKPYNVYRLNVQSINIKNYVLSEETKYSQKATQKKRNVSRNMVRTETFLNCYVEKVQKSVTINLNFKADPIPSPMKVFLHSLKNITKKSLSFPKRNTIHFLCSKTAATVTPLLQLFFSFCFCNSDDLVALYMEFPMNVNGLANSVLVIPSQISHILSLQHFK